MKKEILEKLEKLEALKLNELMIKAHDIFIKYASLTISRNADKDHNHCFEYFNNLNVIMTTDEIFEGYHCDDMIQIRPCLQKAESVEQAWDLIKSDVEDIISDIMTFIDYDNNLNDIEYNDLDFSFMLS